MISDFYRTTKYAKPQHAKPQIANWQHKAGSGKKKPRRFAAGHTRPDDKALTLYPLIRDYPDFGNIRFRTPPPANEQFVIRLIPLYTAVTN